MKKALLFIFLVLLLVLFLFVSLKVGRNFFKKEGGPDVLKVTFLDIGQGDATFIEFPNGQQMLIDCAIDARILEALGRVMPFYDRTLDYLIVSHPDQDHYGGCIDVMNRFDVDRIVYNGYEKDTVEFFSTFMASLQKEDPEYVPLEGEETWEIASTTIRFLYPDHSVISQPNVPGHTKDTGSNNSSIVMKLTFGDQDVLLTADAEHELEAYLVEKFNEQLDVEVLKVGHHGSNTSSIEPFLAATTPVHAVISSGVENKYGHPSRRILKRLERVGATTWRTDLQGDILVTVFPQSVEVKAGK